ncbi:MAG: hypothetical protein JWO55_196 [Candidatus Saccharibacteria bacterium]|jgi:hypothetical protein|nr:hypothetical protein [Candidatus Saccharibacteria bacterium]
MTMNIAQYRNVTAPAAIKQVRIEYIGIVEKYWKTMSPVQYIDDFGRSNLTLPYMEEIVSCFDSSLSYPDPDNKIWMAIRDVAEIRFTPPTPTQDYWRIGFSHCGDDDIERQNEFITSPESAKRLFDEWFSSH